jgi:homoserine dehydrogenase
VDGIDTWHKLILSSNIAFGISLNRAAVPAAGISKISAADVANFTAHGLTCKLVATGKNLGNSSCAAYVQPTLFPQTALEANVPANFNLITLDGDYSGRQSFYGQGAGRYPTAYNVVQDCADLLAGKSFYCPYGGKTEVDNSEKLTYYVRSEADSWLEENTAENWDGAIITKPVSVDAMHQWLKAHPAAFIAAMAE